VPPSKPMDIEAALVGSGVAAAEGGGEGGIYTVFSEGVVVSPVPAGSEGVGDVSGAPAGVPIVVGVVEGGGSDCGVKGPSANESHPPSAGIVFMWHKRGIITQKPPIPGFEAAEPGELDKLEELDELELWEIGEDERVVKANWNQHQNTYSSHKAAILQRPSELEHVQISPCD
jgi:hypothetical protein